MHIGFITPEYPHPQIGNSGGLGTSLRNLVEGLRQKQIEITVFVYQHETESVFEENGIRFHLIQNKSYGRFGWYFYRKHLMRYVNKVVKAEKIDLLEAPDWTGITAFMRFKVPLVVRFHGSDTYFCHLDNRPQKWKNRWFERQALRPATAFVAPTHFAGTMSAELLGVNPDRIQVIHYGLDLSQFNNRAPEKFTSYRLLNIGTLIRKKGVFQLMEIFNQLVDKYPETELFLIGPDSKDVQTGSKSTWSLMQELLSVEAKKRVRYLGKVPYQEVQDHIKNAHVCAFPSLAETLGMVTIESMAMKKAVVNTNMGWAHDLIDDGEDGFLVDPNDIDHFSETVGRLFDDAQLTKNIGEAARIKTERTFDMDKIVDQNIEFYRNVIGR